MNKNDIVKLIQTEVKAEVNKLKAANIPMKEQHKDKYYKTKELFKNYKTYKTRIEDTKRFLNDPELIQVSQGIIANEAKPVNKVFLSEFEKLEDWIEDKKIKIKNWETMVKMAEFGFDFIKDRKYKEAITGRYKDDLEDKEIAEKLSFSDERTVRKYRSIILKELSEILF